jgi:hypothetical protein
MRCTTDRIPSTSEAGKSSGIPFGIIVKPYGDLPAVSIVIHMTFDYDKKVQYLFY